MTALAVKGGRRRPTVGPRHPPDAAGPVVTVFECRVGVRVASVGIASVGVASVGVASAARPVLRLFGEAVRRRAAVGPPLPVGGLVGSRRGNVVLQRDRPPTAKEIASRRTRLGLTALVQVALARVCLVLMLGVLMLGVLMLGVLMLGVLMDRVRPACAEEWPALVAYVLTVRGEVVLARGRLVVLARVLRDRVRWGQEARGRVLVVPARAVRALRPPVRLDSGLGHARTGQGRRALALVARARVVPVRGRLALAGNVPLEQALVAPARVRGPEPSVRAVRARRGQRTPSGAVDRPVDASRRTGPGVGPGEGHPGASAPALVARPPVLGHRRIGGHHVTRQVPARSGCSRASVSVLSARCAPRSHLFLTR